MAFSWNLGLLASTIWIFWRLYEVCQKPASQLEEVLGLDAPPIPEISLSSTTKDEIYLYWKPPDTHHPPHRQHLQVNGVKMEEFTDINGTVHLKGLIPGCSYGIRAILTNATGTATYSRLVQVQTVSDADQDGFKHHSTDDLQLPTRTTSGRRISHSISNPEVPSKSGKQESEFEGHTTEVTSINDLNRTLAELNAEKERLEADIKDETSKFELQSQDLSASRETAKQQAESHEGRLSNTRHDVNDLEKRSKAAQRRKQAREKVLQHERSKRNKMRDEISKWTQDSTAMQGKKESLAVEKVTNHETFDTKLQQVEHKTNTLVNENKSLEDQVKSLGIRLSDGKKSLKIQEDEQTRERQRKEQAQELRIQEIYNETQVVAQRIYEVEIELANEYDYRNKLRDDCIRNPDQYAYIPTPDYSQQFSIMRRRGPSSSFGSSVSRGFTNLSALNPTAAPFSNGFSHFSSRHFMPGPLGLIKQEENDFSTGGAMVSPSANQLLPSGLLGDVDEDESFGLVEPGYDYAEVPHPRTSSWDEDPQSPQSMHSTSHSIVNSPHESSVSIQNFYGMDADRQSLGSTGASFEQLPDAQDSRRRPNFFAFGRQRPRSSVHELPALGSLKTNQSQSFPLPDPDATVRKRNGWPTSMASFLPRGSANVEDATGPAALPKKTRRGLFGYKLEPVESLEDRSASPRPPSVSSYDVGLPRPSSESNPFPWGADGLRQRSSHLPNEWNSSTGAFLSRNASRRPSIQYGSTSNLSLTSTPMDDRGFPYQASQPAPIGTERFSLASKAKPVAKLNPNAPSFTARLFTKKEKPAKADGEADTPDTTKSKSKSKSKTKEKKDKNKNKEIKHEPSIDSDLAVPSEDGSGAHSFASPRLSRDTYSQDDESQSSMLEPSISLGDNPQISTPTSTSQPKESLISRLKRQGSSSKFGAAWKDRSFLNSKKSNGEPSTPGDVEEVDDHGDYLARGLTSDSGTAPGTPQAGVEKEKTGRLSSSWNRVMSITGKSKSKKEDEERDSLEADEYIEVA